MNQTGVWRGPAVARTARITTGLVAGLALLLAAPMPAFADGPISIYSKDASHGGHTSGTYAFGSSGHDYSFAFYNSDVAADGKGSWTIVFAAGDTQSSTGWRDHNTDGNGTTHFKNGGGDVGFTIRYIEVQACNGASTVGGKVVPLNCTYRDYDNPYN